MLAKGSLFSFVSQLDLESLSIFTIPCINKNTSEGSSWGIQVGMLAREVTRSDCISQSCKWAKIAISKMEMRRDYI